MALSKKRKKSPKKSIRSIRPSTKALKSKQQSFNQALNTSVPQTSVINPLGIWFLGLGFLFVIIGLLSFPNFQFMTAGSPFSKFFGFTSFTLIGFLVLIGAFRIFPERVDSTDEISKNLSSIAFTYYLG